MEKIPLNVTSHNHQRSSMIWVLPINVATNQGFTVDSVKVQKRGPRLIQKILEYGYFQK